MDVGPNDRVLLDAFEEFLRTHAALIRAIDDALATQGLVSLDTYDVLVTLEDQPGRRMKMSALAEAVLLSRSGVTRMVDRLESQGLLCRQACPNDRRATHVTLTDAGLAAREAAWPTLRAEILKRFGAHLYPEQAKQLTQAFRKMRERPTLAE